MYEWNIDLAIRTYMGSGLVTVPTMMQDNPAYITNMPLWYQLGPCTGLNFGSRPTRKYDLARDTLFLGWRHLVETY